MRMYLADFRMVVVAVVLLVAACGGGEGGGETSADTPTDSTNDRVGGADIEDTGGTDSGGDTVIEATIVGPEGGTVDLPGGGTLVIPEGALAEDVEITVAAIEDPESELFMVVGPFYEFGPEGLVFSMPATVTVPYDPGAVPPDGAVVLAWSSGGGWEFLTAMVEEGEMISAQLDHFSEGGAAVPADVGDICCVVVGPDGSIESSVGVDTVCTSAGGVVIGKAEFCEDIECCGVSVLGITRAAEVPEAFCDSNDGQVLPAESCVAVCCLSMTSGAPAASVLPLEVCDSIGGQDVGASNTCGELICCDVGDSPLEFSGSVLLPKAACDVVEGTETSDSQCSEICCLQASLEGIQASVKTSGACKALGGLNVGGSELCEGQLCCYLGGIAGDDGGPIPGFPAAFVLPPGLCEDGGGVVVDDAECVDVCCLQATADGGVQASVTSKADCEDQGGVELGAAEACDNQICCGVDGFLGIGLAFPAPEGVCEDSGGVELDAADCAEVCCLFGAGGALVEASVMPAAECAWEGGVVAGNPGLCGDLVCCEVAGGFLGINFTAKVPEGACDGGTVVDDAECGKVCCLVGGGFSTEGKVLSKSACDNMGGTVTDDVTDCEETVCCGASAFGFSVAGNLPTSKCEQIGGSVLDATNCANLCCLMDGKSAVMPKWACESMGGSSAGDPSECDVLFCCSVSGADAVAGLLPYSVCDNTGTFLDPADCENVCCVLGGADPEVLMKAVCVEKGGVPSGDPENCVGVVCCNVNVLGLSMSVMISQSDCEQGGGVVDAANCDEVCCISNGVDGEISAKKTTKATCADSGGLEAGPGESCDELVCCSVSGFGVTGAILIPTATCDQAGSVADASECEKTCCLVGGENGVTSKTMNKSLCDQVGYDAGPEVDCDDLVCCSVSGGMFGSFSVTLPADTCSSKGGTPTDASECEVVCCVSAGGGGKKTTKAACESSGGSDVGPGENCDDLVCCSRSGFGLTLSSMVPAVSCDQFGTVVDASECEKICCVFQGKDGVTSATVNKSICEEILGGASVGSDVDCDELVCCSTSGIFGGISLTVPAAVCSKYGGTPTEASECQETCCIYSDENGDSVAENISKSDCEKAGGYDAGPEVNCKVKVCCGFSALGMDIATMIPMVTCDEFGMILEDEQCNTICCLLPEGGMLITSVYVCTLYDGTAGSWDDCQNNGCFTRYDCDEAPVCKEASCPDGTCVYENMPDGTPCDDEKPETPSSECLNGTCVCTPDCENKDCGPDGCGGVCGPCPDGTTCIGTDCVESTGQPCDPPSSGYSGDVVQQAHVGFDPVGCTCTTASGWAGMESLVLDYFSGSTSGGGSPEPPWTILQTVPDVGSGAWLENIPLDTPITFWLKHEDTGVVVKITVTLTSTGIANASIECV